MLLMADDGTVLDEDGRILRTYGLPNDMILHVLFK